MKRCVPLLAALIGAVNFACKSGECETKQDCPAGMQCNGGVCENIMGGCQNPPCGGIADGGPRDASPDGGIGGGGDAGDGGELGDGGDGGNIGGDGGPDAGPDSGIDAGGILLDPFGEIWVAELDFNGAKAFSTYAEIRDRRTGVFDTYAMEYEQNNVSCVLERETLIAGMVTGLEADHITIDLNNAQQLTYEPMGDGLFEPQAAPTPGLFNGSTGVDFIVVSNNQPNTLEDATGSTDAPTTTVGIITPSPGVMQFLAQPIMLNWVGTSPPANRRTIVELYDGPRRIRLTCRLATDSGMFTLPSDAAADFVAQGPTEPVTLELRYEYLAVLPIGIVGTGASANVFLHAAQGARWPVALP